MQKKIKYIGYYDIKENAKEKRIFSLAAKTKMDYIVHCLQENGYDVEILSLALSDREIFLPGRRIKTRNGNQLVLIPSIAKKNFITKIIRHFWPNIYLLKYLLKNVKKDETIIVYHSLEYRNILSIAKKILGFRLILEVEEIYADVIKSEKISKYEYRVISLAEAYIFSTPLLDEKLNDHRKPSISIYGTYKVEDDHGNKIDDGKIHVVYAGTFDPRKGGAYAAISAARFLGSKYHMHIAGFGTEIENEAIKNSIEKTIKETNCKITYEGLLTGDDYINMLQSCHIGLSTQTSTALFNDTSFPSKVLTYLANGLRVVSTRIKVLETSKVSDLLYYYDSDTSFEIAEAIKKIDYKLPYDSRRRLQELDKQCIYDMRDLINTILKKEY